MKAQNLHTPRGAAVVLVLLLIVLLTVLVVTFSAVVTSETRMSSMSEGSHRAENHARLALDDAMETLQQALAPFDDPFGTNTPPTHFWSLAPGRILHYPLAATQTLRPTPSHRFELHSGAPFTAAGAALSPHLIVDLNAHTASGHRPINDALPPGQTMAVRWRPILADPSRPAGEDNRLIGRYAFWIDDEGAKINVNTADGRHKYDPALSYGPGTPTEVSLAVLDAPGPLTMVQRDAIATRVRTGGFTTPGELGQVPGIPANFTVANRFNLTSYSRTPEFNLFNEPRIQLSPTNLLTSSVSSENRSIFGALFGLNRPGGFLTLTPVKSVYPTHTQVTRALRNQFMIVPNIVGGSGLHDTNLATLIKSSERDSEKAKGWNKTSLEYTKLAEDVAHYLAGRDRKGNPAAWPFAAASYHGKYNLRQIDSITVQLLDLARTSLPKGHGWGYTLGDRTTDNPSPTLALFGLLQDEPVSGLGRSPRLTEFYASISASPILDSAGNAKLLRLQRSLHVEVFFPVGPFHPGFAHESGYQDGKTQLFFGHTESGISAQSSYLNSIDGPRSTKSQSWLVPNPGAGNGSPLGDTNSFWMDNLLVATDQTGHPAGIDFWGNPFSVREPDQERARLFRIPPEDGSDFLGTGGDARAAKPFLRLNPLSGALNTHNRFVAGSYATARDATGGGYSFRTREPVHGLPPVSAVKLKAGLIFWMPFFSISARGMADFTPMESLHGPARRLGNTEGLTGDAPAPRFSPEEVEMSKTLEFPEITIAPGSPGILHAYVVDPFVNKFKEDWIIRTDADEATIGGHNKGFIDQAAVWIGRNYYAPDLGVSQWPDWPRQASLPSAGVLHYIRAKMMPDTGENKGVPFRLLSFAPGDHATQADIPDWAMLDLFSVPHGFWRPGVSPFAPGTRDWALTDFFGGDYIHLTYGGATSGRVNPNGSVLYPWADQASHRLPARTKPLEAVFDGLRYNLDGALVQDPDTGEITSYEAPIDATQRAALANDIADWITANGPLILPGQICDIPAINAYGATVNETRNDIVAQAYGNLTTQGNVFSIWVAAEAITKARSNTADGEVEAGDRVDSSRRMRFIIERYLDLGEDNVPGNAAAPGKDGIVGTHDDVVNPSLHPADPQFLYRVIYAEEIR